MDLPKLKKVTEKKKKKIILLSDDLRMSSGVGTMSREIVMGTIKEYDWVQIAGAIKHPDAGKIVDLNDATRDETGVDDAYLKLYPVDGYGSQELLRQLIKAEKPDAILHYTDPRTGILEGLEDFVEKYRFVTRDNSSVVKRKQKRNDYEDSNHR